MEEEGMRCLKILVMICVMGIAVVAMAAEPPAGGPPTGGPPAGGPPEGGPPSGGGNPFQDRLDALAEKDKARPPAKNGVEFVGSSMFEGWTEVAAHMAPMPAFNRAIGGSKTGDVLAHLDRLVLQYEPRIVVLYSGINDVGEGVSSETAAENIKKIIEGIQADLPGTGIVYIPILDTANRPDVAESITDANSRVREYAEGNHRVTVVDISAALVDEKGNTRPEFLAEDGHHYNEAAYEAMARVVKPVVEEIWSR
jgi:lysophospholipase L1-like esterase